MAPTPLDILDRTINNLKSRFACGGSIKLEALGQDPLLCYRSTPDEHMFHVASLPLTPLDGAVLHEAAVPSPHGKDGQTVYDTSYRAAREIKTKNLALNFDPLSLEHSILSAISQLSVSSDSEDSSSLFARLYKLNSYATGGFFKTHRDTPKANNHIGSIVICLPSEFTGGELVVRHDGEEVKFFDQPVAGVAWAFLFADCEHEVLPVLSGTRVTLAYDVFSEDNEEHDALQVIDLRGGTLYQAMENVAKAQKGARKPLKLGVALKHAYPTDSGGGWNADRAYVDSLPSLLKGYDSEVYYTAEALGFKTSFVAIYNPEDEFDRNKYDRMDDDGSGSSDDESGEDDRSYIPLTSENFFYEHDGCQWEEGEYQLLRQEHGASYKKDVHWIRTGGGAEFLSGSYVRYGNEATIDHIYCSTALIITVPN